MVFLTRRPAPMRERATIGNGCNPGRSHACPAYEKRGGNATGKNESASRSFAASKRTASSRAHSEPRSVAAVYQGGYAAVR